MLSFRITPKILHKLKGMGRGRRMTKNENEYCALLHERDFAMMGYQLAFKHKLALDGCKLGSMDRFVASVQRARKDKST